MLKKEKESRSNAVQAGSISACVVPQYENSCKDSHLRAASKHAQEEEDEQV
jgi:hypothetical protein